MSCSFFQESFPDTGLHPSNCIMQKGLRLELTYPLGSILDAFVTNVHNVPQLHFFMFVKNAENAQHFANVRYASTPPNAYKSLRIPREGYVFAMRLGESTMVRAIRLRTMCITTTREVYLPDIGRNEVLDENDAVMYHLPLKLRAPPGIAVPCQLRGVNDDVTILPDNMRSFLRGLLFRSVKLRVDGYNGEMLKVQLLDVTFDQLMRWNAERGPEEHDFHYALNHVIVNNPKDNDLLRNDGSRLNIRFTKSLQLSPIFEHPLPSDDKMNFNDKNFLIHPSVCTPTPSNLPSPLSSDNSVIGLNEIIEPAVSYSGQSSDVNDVFYSVVTTFANSAWQENERATVEHHSNAQAIMAPLDFQAVSKKLKADITNSTAEKLDLRPLLGRINTQVRPILGAANVPKFDKSWKRDVLPALMIIDNRQTLLNFSRDDLLTITPTYIGQLERFFGIIHRRNECYMQHMWTDDEIPWSSRFTGSAVPYVFNIVLAKHSGDFKWYRAKVIEVSKEQHTALVFFVDYGGVEYVDIWNLANLSTSISKLPFQAVLFRLSDLVDITTTKAEYSFGVEFLRSVLLKKSLTVRVVGCRTPEITICFEDPRFSAVPATLIRKGIMKHLGTM